MDAYGAVSDVEMMSCIASVTSVQVVDATSASVVPKSSGEPRRFWRPNGGRLPGSYMPGFVCAGIYRGRGHRELWMVGKAEEAVAVDLADSKYTRVVVQVADPEATVGSLQSAIRS